MADKHMTHKQRNIKNAYDRGYTACDELLWTQDRNPYKQLHLRQAWDEGWTDAANDNKESEE